MTMKDMDMMTTARERVTTLLDRHDCELEAHLRSLRDEEQAEAADLRSAVNENAASALASALKDIEFQIHRERWAGSLGARVLTTLPSWMLRHLPVLDEDVQAEGKRSVVIVPPRVDTSSGPREPFALAAFDATPAVLPDRDRS